MKSNLFLRIPTAVAELLSLKQGEVVNLRVKGLKDFEVTC
jgi:antitoxin component of MazEF toxin-antitoxin module